MPKQIRYPLIYLLVILSGVAILLLVVSPQIAAQQVADNWKQRVLQQMSAVNLSPEQTCIHPSISDPQEDADATAYNQARANALANLLAAPETQGLSLQQLETIFSEAVGAATNSEDGARLMDEQNGFVLVGMKIAFCAHRHRWSYLPPLYVFSRTGEFWELGSYMPSSITWMEDRWVGLVDVETSSYQLLSFVQIVQNERQWGIQFFGAVPNGPGLTYLESPTIRYVDGYRRIMLPDTNIRYAPAPCEFGDSLRVLEPRSASVTIVDFSHSWFAGDLTFAWQDGHYVLTDETPYEVTIVLNDLSRLEENAPTETEIAQAQNFLRSGSWRDYCVARLVAPEIASEER